MGHVTKQREHFAQEEIGWRFCSLYILADEEDSIFELSSHVFVLSHKALVDKHFWEVFLPIFVQTVK